MRRRALLLAPLLPGAAAGGELLRIGSWNRQEETATRAVEALLRQAYAALGQPLQFVDLPLRRALADLLSGALDGNLMRAPALIAEHAAQLLRVDPPVLQLNFWAYGPQAAPRQWQDLDERRVGMLRGVMAIERQLPPGTRRLEAGTLGELQRLLERGMADLLLTAEPAQAPPLLSLPRQLCGMAPQPLHHVLRREHAALAARLSALLSQWQRNGKLEELLRLGLR
jgi:hypothetical protein